MHIHPGGQMFLQLLLQAGMVDQQGGQGLQQAVHKAGGRPLLLGPTSILASAITQTGNWPMDLH